MKQYELTRHKYLSDSEQAHLNQVLEQFKVRDFRDTTMIWTGLHTGARASEILNIKAADLCDENKTIFIWGIKGSNNREIPVPPWLYTRIRSLTLNDERPFPISYNRFGEIWRNYRPVKKNLHCLRHTFAINVYRKTKDLVVLRLALGHRSVINTMIYADYQYRSTELRRAILG